METEIPDDLKPLLFDGKLFYGKWGEIFFVSKNRLSYTDLAGTAGVTTVKDSIYGRYFLQDIEPAWQRDSIMRDLYRYAQPWVTDLSGLDTQQLIVELLTLFQRNELRVWRLTDGWAVPPEPVGGNQYTPAGSTGVAGASAGPAPATTGKASKPKGGSSTAAQPLAAKAAGHEADATPKAELKAGDSRKVEPTSLEHAQQILAERRKQIEQSGYQPKYSDAELLAMAEAGDIANERFHVRLVFNNPDKALDSTLGFRRNSGRAPYWATTFDMAEAADTDPEILACIFGIENYTPDDEFSLVIIDNHNLPPQAERQTFVPTFANMTEFCNNELTSEEMGNCSDVTEVLNDEFAAEYQAFMADYAKTGESEYDRDAIRDHAEALGANKELTEKILLRQKIQAECGANPLFSGNGLTKVNHKNRYAADVPQQYGVAETFTFERDPLTITELAGSATVLPAKPIKG